MAVSWVSSYFFLHTPTPIIFYFIGAKVAGQFGLTMTIANIIGAIGMSWATSVTPRFTHLVEEKKFINAHQLFMDNMKISIAITAAIIFALSTSSYIFKDFFLFKRILPTEELAILLTCLAGFHIANSMNAYFRAYRIEPLAKVNLLITISAILLHLYLVQTELLFALVWILICTTLQATYSFFLSKKILKNSYPTS